MVSEAKYKSNHGEGLKILIPKQIIQRLPIALSQVKSVNTSEKLSKWNHTNHVFFLLSKRNNKKYIQECNKFNKVIKKRSDTEFWIKKSNWPSQTITQSFG